MQVGGVVHSTVVVIVKESRMDKINNGLCNADWVVNAVMPRTAMRYHRFVIRLRILPDHLDLER